MDRKFSDKSKEACPITSSLSLMKMATLRTVFCEGLFAGKVAIVTGGGTGIGKAIATELARLGCKVVIASRKVERLQESAKEINRMIATEGGGAGGSPRPLRELVYPFQCNIRKEEQVEALMKYTVETHGRIDYLVNNGGGQFISPFAGIRTKGWHAVIDTDLNGTYYCLKHAYHYWMEDHGGAIVNIIVDMWRGFPGFSHSGAARAGVENLTKTLAVEWAPNAIRINSVAPGVIYSPTAAANYPPGMFAENLEVIPAKRIGYPEEVSSAVCFFLSPGADYITGCTLPVDGGWIYYKPNWVVPDHKGFPLELKTEFAMPKEAEEDEEQLPKAKL